MHKYLEGLVSCLKEAVIFNIIGAAAAFGVLVFLNIPLTASFGFIVLIESTGLMLVGGALGVAGGPTSRRVMEFLSRRKVDPKTIETSDARAAVYAVTGMLLFAEGAAMAAFLG